MILIYKKLRFFILFLFVILTLIGCQKTNENINVGLDLPLSGKLAFYGNEVKDAFIAFETLKNPKNINFIFEDNQSKASNSVTVYNELAFKSNIPLIISSNSPLSIPLRPLALKNKKVLLALVTGARNFGEANEWSFRDAINQNQEGVALAKYVIEKTRYRKGITLVVNDDYGLGGEEAFATKFNELGGKILAKETFAMSERNFRNKLIKLFQYNPEFLFLVGREQTIINSIQQIKELNKEILILTSDAFDSPNILNALGKSAREVIFASYHNNMQNNEAKEFIAFFEKQFNRKPGIYAFDAYVAAHYLQNLFSKVGNDSEKLREALSIMVYNSNIKGTLKTNKIRDIISPIAIYKIENNLNKKVIHIVK